MNCDECQNQILTFADTVPSESARSNDAVRLHIAICPACRKVFARLNRIESVVAQLPVPSSESARAAFLQRLITPTEVAAESRRSSSSGKYKPVATATTLASSNFPLRLRTSANKAVAGLAAAVLFGAGTIFYFSNKSPTPVEVAEQPRHALLGKEVNHYVRLSSATTPTDRLAVWGDWAADIGLQSRAVHKVANPEEMATLAAMFEKTVSKGMVAQASQFPPTLPAAERHEALTAAISKLDAAEHDATEMARTAPTITQKYFATMATTASQARQILHSRLRGEA